MSHFHLPADAREGGDAVGKPHVHPGSAHGSNSIAADASYPNHIGHIVSHLDEGGRHDGNGKFCQGGEDIPFQEVDISAHSLLSSPFCQVCAGKHTL